MALPKKGTRRITVDKVDYRWRISVDEDYERLLPPKVQDIHSLVVESPEFPGRILIVEFPLADYREGFGRAITPKLVVDIIKAVTAEGWPRFAEGPCQRYWRCGALLRREKWV